MTDLPLAVGSLPFVGELAALFAAGVLVAYLCYRVRLVPIAGFLLAGVAIGGVVAFEAMMGGPISGASMNPARSLGPALVGLATGTSDPSSLWVYLVGPVAGALLAVPILVIVKVFCDHFEALRNVGNFLGAQHNHEAE